MAIKSSKICVFLCTGYVNFSVISVVKKNFLNPFALYGKCLNVTCRMVDELRWGMHFITKKCSKVIKLRWYIQTSVMDSLEYENVWGTKGF